MRYFTAITFLATMIATGAAAANQPTALATFQPYRLKDGMNTVQHMTTDGRAGTIIQLHHQGDHDLNTYEVFMAAIAGSVVWFDVDDDLSELDGNKGFHDTLAAGGNADYAFRTVRFGTALVNSKRTTVALIAAKRDTAGPMNAPAAVKIMVWAMTHDDDFDYDYFSKITAFQTHGKYCDANVALLREARVAMPPGSEATNSANGC